MLKSIEMLREILESCQSGNPLSENQSDWLGRSLDGFLSQPGTSLREAFGLRAPQGGVPWWREEEIRARDHALRALAQTYCKDCSISARARYVGKLARRYAASSWRFDRGRGEMEGGHGGIGI